MQQHEHTTIQNFVKENYAKVATSNDSGCGCSTSCCGTSSYSALSHTSSLLGYSSSDVLSVPEGSNMGLGCGNPQAIAALKAGETVLDLGSGGGFDCFLAAQVVGEKGSVIGVDMTPEMIAKANKNLEKTVFKNISFHLGTLEALPLEDNTVDVIISNCVINLSPDKQQVFNEAFRVLRKGGRLAVSDIVATQILPQTLKNDMALHVGCMAGASTIQELEDYLKHAGFEHISITLNTKSREFIRDWTPQTGIEEYVCSAVIEAKKSF